MKSDDIKKLDEILEPLVRKLWEIHYSIRLERATLRDTASQLADLSEKLIEAADHVDYMDRS